MRSSPRTFRRIPRLLDESLVSPDSVWPLASTGVVQFSRSPLSCSLDCRRLNFDWGNRFNHVRHVLLTSCFCSSRTSASRDSCLRTNARFSSLNSPTSSLSRSRGVSNSLEILYSLLEILMKSQNQSLFWNLKSSKIKENSPYILSRFPYMDYHVIFLVLAPAKACENCWFPLYLRG